jgi:hypothetical protein
MARKAKPFGYTPTSPTIPDITQIFRAPRVGRGGARRGGTVAPALPEPGVPPIAMPTAPDMSQPMDTLSEQPTGIFQPTTPAADMAVPTAPEIAAPVPSMASVGLNTLTTEQGLEATPSLQAPTASNVMGPEATQARLGGMFGEAPQTLSQVTAQDPASIAAQQASDSFAMESAAREDRLGSGLSVRPGIDVGSQAMQRDRAAVGLEPFAAPIEGISQAQQRDLMARGVDPETGEPISSGLSATDAANIRKTEAETAKILSEIGSKGSELNLSPAEKSRDSEAGKQLANWDSQGRATVTSNIEALNNVIGGLEDGQIKTRGFIDALPFGADWARAIMNPEAQDAKDRVQGVIFQTLRETLGAQFTEREGQRLVEASYNAKLGPEQNAARLRDYTKNLQRAAEARESQLQYLKENRTLQGYTGPDPEAIMSQTGRGEGGSPIQGDVDVASAADDILNAQ